MNNRPKRFSARRQVETVVRLLRGEDLELLFRELGMTAALITQEGQAAIFFAVDQCSLECVGVHAAKRGTRFEALEPLKQGVREIFWHLRTWGRPRLDPET